MLVNWEGIKRIFWTYKYKRQKLIQNLEFKYSAPRKPSIFKMSCLGQSKMLPGVFSPHERHPNREIHPHSYKIPTADYGIRINPTSVCTNTCTDLQTTHPAERDADLTNHSLTAARQPRESPQPRFDQVQMSMQEGIASQSHQLQQSRWPCSVTVFCSTAGSIGSYTLQQ